MEEASGRAFLPSPDQQRVAAKRNHSQVYLYRCLSVSAPVEPLRNMRLSLPFFQHKMKRRSCTRFNTQICLSGTCAFSYVVIFLLSVQIAKIGCELGESLGLTGLSKAGMQRSVVDNIASHSMPSFFRVPWPPVQAMFLNSEYARARPTYDQ
jgi:hypothetical protein